MSDCMYMKRLLEEEVQSPIEQFLTSVEQKCEQFHQWVQEQAEQSVARALRSRRKGFASRGHGRSTGSAAP